METGNSTTGDGYKQDREHILSVYVKACKCLQVTGRIGKKLFLLFCWLFCILVVAAFADVVAGTFNGFAVNDAGTVTKVAANGAVATTSMLFIFEAVALGFFLK